MPTAPNDNQITTIYDSTGSAILSTQNNSIPTLDPVLNQGGNLTTPTPLDPKEQIAPPTGGSVVTEPNLSGSTTTSTTSSTTTIPTTIPTSTTTSIIPTIGNFMGSLGSTFAGGGGGGASTNSAMVVEKKKPFPYWLVAVALVGSYLIFRKK